MRGPLRVLGLGCVAAALVGLLVSCGGDEPKPSAKRGVLADATVSRTAHFEIRSLATEAQTAEVSAAVEALYVAYTDTFGAGKAGKLHQLVLYKDRDQFRANNGSKSWAEAYYRAPRCYAYYSTGRSPYHWMIHEATHQLMWEVSRFPSYRWIKEGVACYFSTSRLDGDAIKLGVVDPDTYPIWWLRTLELTGNLEADTQAGRVIPLRQLMDGSGPDVDRFFNLYYMHYWSWAHFLFEGAGGRYAAGFKKLIAAGGSAEQFEQLIGPVDQVQAEWYAYLQQQVQAHSATKPTEDPR